MSVVINILASIGLIVIISYIVYSLYKYISNLQTQNAISQIYPPPDYMQNTGIMCPDYWVNTGVDSNGNYICKNTFTIPTTNNGGCDANQLKFDPIKSGYTWEYNNANGLTSMTDDEKYAFLNDKGTNASISRCDWINKCGPAKNVQGIWSGVNEICNSPPPTSS